MLLIDCPHCGPRAEIEFRYGGEAQLQRPGPDCSDAEWAEYLYMRSNARGERAERWSHARGCGQFFVAVRNSQTDAFVTTSDQNAPHPSAAL